MSELIPIINSQTGEQTGEIAIGEDGKVLISGRIDYPWGQGEIEALVILEEPDLPPARHFDGVEPPDPVLTERLAAAFPSAYERLVAEGPRHVQAAARGLAVHERALALVDERSLPYEHAIQIAAEEARERNDAN